MFATFPCHEIAPTMHIRKCRLALILLLLFWLSSICTGDANIPTRS